MCVWPNRVPECDNKSNNSELNSLNRQGDDSLHLFHLKPHLNPHIPSFQQLQFFFFAFEVINRSSNNKKKETYSLKARVHLMPLCVAGLIISFSVGPEDGRWSPEISHRLEIKTKKSEMKLMHSEFILKDLLIIESGRGFKAAGPHRWWGNLSSSITVNRIWIFT